ncbi:ABC transporter substrate-binding protein [Microvirga sp. 2TAF3]|uniref:ABC transporter substrate-binding protein n=1 Tax=Microvirga sp. 2TAF3 TaxID=3233014 RepID=UPI003F9972B7
MKPSKLAYAALLAGALFSGSALAEEVKIPAQKLDSALQAKLPKEILTAGEMISVNSGSFPPYEIVSDTRTMTGASSDLTDALGQLLGVKIHHESVSGLSSILSGIKSGRYQFAMGPIGDFADREKSNDFVDWVQEYVVFAVQNGNPKGIKGLSDTCGLRIAVQSGGSAEKVIKQQANVCAETGKPALEVQSFPDQPTSILAVRSKRSDAFFSSQAPLTYFVQQSNGQLELAGVGQANGFDDLFQGAVVPKDSPLGPVLLEGLQKLYENGTYAAIMKKWGLENNILKTPGLNLAGKNAK